MIRSKKRIVGASAVGLVFAGMLAWWLVGGFDIPFRGDDPMGDLLQPLDQSQVEQGHDLYLTNCSQCHGVDGEGRFERSSL